MAVLNFDSRPLVVAVLAVPMLVMLAACEQKPAEKAGASTSEHKEETNTAPGIIVGNETLPVGHPPIEELQNTTADTLSMQENGSNDETGFRPDDEPEHPPSSGEELKVAMPDSVVGQWLSVQLEVTLTDGSKREISAVLGEETVLLDADLMVRAEIFLPAYISDFETIKSASNELTNPAVKVRLFKDKKATAVGWVFQNLPEFDSFKSDMVAFRLVSAEPRH